MSVGRKTADSTATEARNRARLSRLEAETEALLRQLRPDRSVTTRGAFASLLGLGVVSLSMSMPWAVLESQHPAGGAITTSAWGLAGGGVLPGVVMLTVVAATALVLQPCVRLRKVARSLRVCAGSLGALLANWWIMTPPHLLRFAGPVVGAIGTVLLGVGSAHLRYTGERGPRQGRRTSPDSTAARLAYQRTTLEMLQREAHPREPDERAGRVHLPWLGMVAALTLWSAGLSHSWVTDASGSRRGVVGWSTAEAASSRLLFMAALGVAGSILLIPGARRWHPLLLSLGAAGAFDAARVRIGLPVDGPLGVIRAGRGLAICGIAATLVAGCSAALMWTSSRRPIRLQSRAAGLAVCAGAALTVALTPITHWPLQSRLETSSPITVFGGGGSAPEVGVPLDASSVGRVLTAGEDRLLVSSTSLARSYGVAGERLVDIGVPLIERDRESGDVFAAALLGWSGEGVWWWSPRSDGRSELYYTPLVGESSGQTVRLGPAYQTVVSPEGDIWFIGTDRPAYEQPHIVRASSDADGTLTTTLIPYPFDEARGELVAAEGDSFVTQAEDGRLYRRHLSGLVEPFGCSAVIHVPLSRAMDETWALFDRDHNLWLSDRSGNRVVVRSSDGAVIDMGATLRTATAPYVVTRVGFASLPSPQRTIALASGDAVVGLDNAEDIVRSALPPPDEPECDTGAPAVAGLRRTNRMQDGES